MFYFNNNGKAASDYVSKIKKYTVKGLVLAANNDDSNYGYVEVQAGNFKKIATGTVKVDYVTSDWGAVTGSNKVLVNTTGTVQKSKFNLKDVNDMYYVTDKNGAIVYADSKKLYTSKADGRTGVNVTRDGKTTEYWIEN